MLESGKYFPRDPVVSTCVWSWLHALGSRYTWILFQKFCRSRPDHWVDFFCHFWLRKKRFDSSEGLRLGFTSLRDFFKKNFPQFFMFTVYEKYFLSLVDALFGFGTVRLMRILLILVLKHILERSWSF